MNRRAILTCGLIVVLLFVTPGALAQAPTPGTKPANQDFIPDQILVRFQSWVTPQAEDQLMVQRGLRRIRQIHPLETQVLQLPPGLTVEKAIEVLSHRPEVGVVEPNYILRSFGEIVDQWGLAKIQATEAWAYLGSNPDQVLLATVDTGIDRLHPDLGANIWTNPDELPGNGVDDDGNGYIDDTWGWNFVNNNNNPSDDNMHGTAVSSVEAAVRDGNGVAGVCPWCKLVAVKVLDANGSGAMDVVARGIIYAADNGARVINLSMGAGAGTQVLEDAVNYAWSKGVLVVAAAGNSGNGTLSYPAAYANAMAIASTNNQDYRSCFSQYGTNYISVAAPGESVLSAIPNGGYGTYSGTSLATPHVTGLGGLLFAQDRNRTNAVVRNLIERTAVDLGPAGKDAFFGTGRIDALRAVMGNTSPTTPPQGMFSTSDSSTGYPNSRKLVRDSSGNLHMIWHGQDGSLYRVLYAVSADSGVSWSSPQVVFSSTAETYHPALAIDRNKLYVVFPSKHNASYYQIFFTSKSLAGGVWDTPTALMGGTYDTVRPDIYLDPSNGRLHVVASSLDNATSVYYTASGDSGVTWAPVNTVSVTLVGAQNSRYATIHADGPSITIAGRTVELYFGLLPIFRAFSVRSVDNGNTWSSPLVHSELYGIFTGEYGLSLAGEGNRLYLIYEDNGSIFFKSSIDGASWSTAENLGAGAWPSITQAGDGQAWGMWVSDGNLTMRHYTGSTWDPAEALGKGTYPSLKLGVSGGQVEWATTYCSGAPFRVGAGARSVGANHPPSAAADVYTTSQDSPLVIPAPGVLGNDTDPDGNILNANLVTGPAHGVLSLGKDGSFTYTPAAGFYGEDSFTYKANDGIADSNIATVTITITSVNHPPVLSPIGDQIVDEQTLLSFTALATDPDLPAQVLTFSLADGSTGHVPVGALISPSGVFTWTPTEAQGPGIYSFDVCVSDGVAKTCETISVIVSEVNFIPIVANDTFFIDEDTLLNVAAPGILANDSDPDGNVLTAILVSGPSHGALTFNADGSFSYTPGANFNGEDSFTYMANDGVANSNPATVTLVVKPVNDPPLAADDSYTTLENQTLTVAAPGVLANDIDIDGDTLTSVLVSEPANGTLVLNANGSFSYTPKAGFTGTDGFTYQANDGKGGSNTGTSRITVQSNIIFANSFESGNLAAWSSSVTDGGDLSASANAAMVGAYGMQALINNNTAIYVTDETPAAESRYQARFYFDPNSIRMQSGNSHYIFYGYSGTSTVVLRIEFRYYKGSYQLRAGLVNDSTTWKTSNWFTIGDSPHSINLDWRAATIAGAGNGGLTFSIDGTVKANLTLVDNDTRRIDRVRLGAVSGIDNGTRGVYYFDDFESRR